MSRDAVFQVIDKYYPRDREARHILLTHSRLVADKALSIARNRPELQVDMELLEQGAMVHDIGIIFTKAPDIDCHGEEPYIKHGLIGGQLLRENGLDRLAPMAENHTGTGITRQDIQAQALPLPAQDFIPRTIEEQILAFADKFYSKGRDLTREKSLEEIRRELDRHGKRQVEQFDTWCSLFI